MKPELEAGGGWTRTGADVLDHVSRWSLWLIALFVMVVIPWFFGGMGPEGYWFTVWAGRACLVPLGLWVVSSILIRRKPPAGFWVAVVCWGLLAVQVWVSMGNPSQMPQPPWVGTGYDPVAYNHWLPSTATVWHTPPEGQLWLSVGLLGLSSYAVGLGRKALGLLVWLIVINVAVLAALGIPFKYSGDYLMLGRYPMPENYFFSTFTYHNHWCAFALLGLAGAVGLFAQNSRVWVRCILLVIITLIFASALVSVSRLGTLLMAAFLVFAGIVYLMRRVSARPVAWRRGLLLSLCVIGSLVMILGAVIYLNRNGPGSVGQRSWGYIIKSNPFTSRVMLVEDAIPMVRAKPVFGWGLGAFGVAFRDYQRAETIVVYNQGRVTRYEHCHNDWMERLVELGWVGMLLLCIPLVVWWITGQWVDLAGAHAFWVYSGLIFLGLFALGDMVFVNRCVLASTMICLALLRRGTRAIGAQQ